MHDLFSPPPPSKVRRRDAPHPEVKVATRFNDAEVVVTVVVSPASTVRASADLSATCSFNSQGDLVIEGSASLKPLFHEYECVHPTPLFVEPSPHAAIGRLRRGTIVRGGLPSSEGWIALEDDESWIFADFRVHALEPELARVPFQRPLPSDVQMDCATCKELCGGLVITVPRRHTQPEREAVAHVKAPPPPSPVSTAPPPPPPLAPSLSRTYSSASITVLATLDSINEQLSSIQAACDEADSALNAPSRLDLRLRSQLASLHGNANTLLAARMDAILISDLTSGKEHARLRRKSLVKQAERLVERLESQVRRFDKIRARGKGAEDTGGDGVQCAGP